MPTHCICSATTWLSGQPKYPLFDKIVGRSPNVLSTTPQRWLPMWCCMPPLRWFNLVVVSTPLIAKCMQITSFYLFPNGGHIVPSACVEPSDIPPHFPRLMLPILQFFHIIAEDVFEDVY